MFRRLRTNLSRMLAPHLYTPEGFRMTELRFVPPHDTEALSVAEKRAVSICNLFANHHKTIDEIAQLLETERRAVISVLIQKVFILDRRRSHQRYPRTNRRH